MIIIWKTGFFLDKPFSRRYRVTSKKQENMIGVHVKETKAALAYATSLKFQAEKKISQKKKRKNNSHGKSIIMELIGLLV